MANFSSIKRSILTNKTFITGFLILTVIFLTAILGPYINGFSVEQINLSHKNSPPNTLFWFGTDELGRDLFTRTCQGARISLSIATIAAIIDLVMGVLWGAISAYYGGAVDHMMMRTCDVLNSIPHLLMVILLIVVIGPGLITIIIALSFTGWINMARITRSKALEIKMTEYVRASYCFGGSTKHIIFHHILPNSIVPIIAAMTLSIPTAIFSEAFLSFLGLGIQAPQASLGSMANDGLNALRYYPWRTFFPSLLICVTMLGFHLAGNGLRESLDPRLVD
jgi:oligopeptide transport system permease protein